jgi:hypothetical protein
MGQARSATYPLIMSYLTLRRVIGWIAVLLPVVLILANIFFHQEFSIKVDWPDSASQYYYSGLRDVFVGSLCALGVFLVAYRGYDRVDLWITNVAGACAIGVALFPTTPSTGATSSQHAVGITHDVFAISLIALMGIMALRFAKAANPDPEKPFRSWFGFGNTWPEDSNRTSRKKRRNIAYRCSGAVTLLCALIFAIQPLSFFDAIKNAMPFLYLIETLSIFAFGVAWFVKGRSLLLLVGRRELRKAGLRSGKNYAAVQRVQGKRAMANEADAATEQAVLQFLGSGSSARDTADALGISRQRVTEIAADAI